MPEFNREQSQSSRHCIGRKDANPKKRFFEGQRSGTCSCMRMVGNSEPYLVQFVYSRDRARLLLAALRENPLKHFDRNDFTSNSANTAEESSAQNLQQGRPFVTERDWAKRWRWYNILLCELWSRWKNLTFEYWWRRRRGNSATNLSAFSVGFTLWVYIYTASSTGSGHAVDKALKAEL